MLRSILFTLASFIFVNHAAAVLTVALQVSNEQCGNNNGSLGAMPTGGVAPYTFLWSNGSTAQDITGLNAGAYSVTVTDAMGTEVTENATLLDVPFLEVPAIYYAFGGYVQVSTAGLSACEGQCNGGYAWMEGFTPGAIHPLEYTPAPTASFGNFHTFTGYCADEFPQLTITDATGCTGTFTVGTLLEAAMDPVVVGTVIPSCVNTGSITVDVGASCQCDITLLDDLGQLVAYAGTFLSGPVTFNNLAPGLYQVQRFSPYTAEACYEFTPVLVADLGPDCGVVSGTVFLDHDQDCVQDGNDEGVPYQVLDIGPGNEYAITDAAGHYERGLVYGGYTLQQVPAPLLQLCPAAVPVPFTLTSFAPAATINLADSSLIPLDLTVQLESTPARPGFILTYHARIASLSGQLGGPMEATFTFDPLLTVGITEPAPSGSTANSVTWSNLPTLGAFGEAWVSIQLSVPADPGLIGTVLTAGFTASTPFTEVTLTNNSATLNTTITGSYDPNVKVARTSSGQSTTEYFIGTDEYIDYVIHFQNTGTDTAFTVVVTDTLSEELDMATFQQGLASHPFTVAFRSGRVVEWRFDDILLMDSTASEAESHGLVSFRIRPAQPVLAGAVISNAADIYFDFNPSVHTEDAVLIAELGTTITQLSGPPVLQPYPVPVHDRVNLPGVAIGSAYQLHGTDGRLVLTGRLDGPGLDLNSLSEGSYLLGVLHLLHGWQYTQIIKQ